MNPTSQPLLDDFYTTKEIAERWKASTREVQLIFRSEPGVMRVGRLIRIPPEVLDRVERRQTIYETA